VIDGRYTFAQVSLQLRSSTSGEYQHQCGGSIIAPDIILTAGHCSQWFDQIYVDRYDFNDLNDTYSSFTPQSITVHPLFDGDLFRYDFTIVHINRSIPFVSPLRLNNDSAIPSEFDALSILGWGAIQKNSAGVTLPSVLQKGTVYALQNDVCEATIVEGQSLYQGEIYDEMLCAQAPVRFFLQDVIRSSSQGTEQ
jgi:secreted trypsin-like serine protease